MIHLISGQKLGRNFYLKSFPFTGLNGSRVTAGLAASAVGYRRGKYFGRSPAVLANLIALGVVSYQVEAHLWFVAIPLTALAGTTLIAGLRAIPTDL